MRDALSGSGFRTIDDLVRAPQSSGVVFVQGSVTMLDALARHVERRARLASRFIVSVSASRCDDTWREIAARLGIMDASDPTATAAAIAAAAQDGIIVVLDSRATDWGSAVVRELANLASDASSPLILLLSPTPPPFASAIVVSIDSVLGEEDGRRWWDALARDAGRQLPDRLDRLDHLEAWWSAARATQPILDAPAPSPDISAPARALLARMILSQRSWPIDSVSRLGPASARQELVARCLIETDEKQHLYATHRADGIILTDEEQLLHACAVAAALELSWPAEPWASVRASELYALANEPDASEAAAVRALSGVTDPAARQDFWRRWEEALNRLSAPQAAERVLRAADLALRVGDIDRALGFARSVAARDRDGDDYDAMLMLGRATMARGDLTTAGIALNKAMECAPDPAHRARAAVEMAETRYMANDLDEARRHATAALVDADNLATRLQARNVIGKLHLANSAWDEAERHFATDACEAACGGELIAELRARLNRAIAVQSNGRRDEARVMLTSVLQDGERLGEPRAVSFALHNLATIAILRHDYREALSLSERAIDVVRRIGEKIFLAHLITNLADLRLRIGLVAEAEQALAFGRRACGAGMPAERQAYFSLADARIHLARGRTMEAQASLNEAVATAGGARVGVCLSACYRFAARVALEDGDLDHVERALDKARYQASSVRERAEVALLEAMRSRAAGDAFRDGALGALELAREANDVELAREAHLLAYHAAIAAEDGREASQHLDAAIALRNRVADVLPEELRSRYLARHDMAELARIAARRDQAAPLRPGTTDGARTCERCGEAGCSGCSASRSSRPPPPDGSSRGSAPAQRRMVGEDPAMIALAAAIQKVGQSDATVLVQGESGTGKELVAEAIHEASLRRGGPLVKVNCAALVETLLLSELFGHEKGSFTGAAARRRGRFEMAEGGTLFLDEIGDISARTQVALLRVLQDKTFERVGGVTPIRANVRVVCATHRDLRAMVARGQFREDLYYRLRGVVLEVPALRQRIGDLPLIAAAILNRIARDRGAPAKRLSVRALGALAKHAWPGNIRELENALRAAALFAEDDFIDLEDFTNNVDGLREIQNVDGDVAIPTLRIPLSPESGTGMKPARTISIVPPPSANEPTTPTDLTYAQVRAGTSLSDMKRQIERDCIARALAESQGNITRAAALLGMKRPRLSQLVKQYGLGAVEES